MKKTTDKWNKDERRKKLAAEHKGTKWDGNILRKHSEAGSLVEPHETAMAWDPVIGWYCIA